jgi:hypothetical protein
MSPGVDLTGAGTGTSIIDGETLHHCLVGQDLGEPELTGITFLDGRTTGTGGLAAIGGAGVLIYRSAPVIGRCEFRSCEGPGIGEGASGLYLIGGGGSRVEYNLFVDNHGGGIGGALGILQVSCCRVDFNTFVRNEAGDGGGAIEINASFVLLRNNIFADNSAAVRAGAVLCQESPSVTASCNLFWENSAPVDEHVTDGCITLGSLQNLVADPIFCDPAVDDFTVHENSPAAPDHPSGCGGRGAYPVGCSAVSVDPESWTRVKARYR